MIFRKAKRSVVEATARRRVDRLIGTRPARLEVPIAAAPGRDELFAAYVTAFGKRGYELQALDRSGADTWKATFERRRDA